MLALPSLAAASRSTSIQNVGLRLSSEAESKDAFFSSLLAEAKGGLPGQRKTLTGSSSTPSIPPKRPRFVAAGLGRHPQVQPSGRRQLDPLQTEVMQDELNTKRRVYKLRNELRQSRSTAAMMQVLAEKEIAGREVREETARLHGAHLAGTVNYIEPATDEMVAFVATALMKQLALNEPEPSNRGWFKLFKAFDANGDGHISFAEVRIRYKLELCASPSGSRMR